MCRAALPPINYRRQSRRRGFAIFGDKSPFALSRKWKNGKRVDSRSRENDGAGAPSNYRRQSRRELDEDFGGNLDIAKRTKRKETNFSVENNLPKNFSVNAAKGAQVLALVFVIGAAVFTNGDQTAIAANIRQKSGCAVANNSRQPKRRNRG